MQSSIFTFSPDSSQAMAARTTCPGGGCPARVNIYEENSDYCDDSVYSITCLPFDQIMQCFKQQWSAFIRQAALPGTLFTGVWKEWAFSNLASVEADEPIYLVTWVVRVRRGRLSQAPRHTRRSRAPWRPWARAAGEWPTGTPSDWGRTCCWDHLFDPSHSCAATPAATRIKYL